MAVRVFATSHWTPRAGGPGPGLGRRPDGRDRDPGRHQPPNLHAEFGTKEELGNALVMRETAQFFEEVGTRLSASR